MIPNELQNYLHENKAVRLLDGYLLLLNDAEREKYGKITLPVTEQHGNMEPFALTAFGDLLAWDGQYVYMFRLAEGRMNVILSGFSFFFQNIEDEAYQKDYFDIDLFKQAEQEVGTLCEGECYSFEPIPLLGGDKSVQTIRKNKTAEYIEFLVNFN
jgi:hypothetical protein